MASAKDNSNYSTPRGAELAGEMIARLPVDGRQGAAAPNVVNTSSQEGSQVTTG